LLQSCQIIVISEVDFFKVAIREFGNSRISPVQRPFRS
jgi:hypothetical protein